MKFAIAGAGAIGAYLGAQMTRAGLDVTLFARGPHLRAMQACGIRVHGNRGNFEARPKVSGDLESIGPADVVFLGVKAHSLIELAPRLAPLLRPDATVVSMQNGIPWWYFQKHGGPFDGLRLERLDPGGVISAAIEAGRVLGSVVYLASEIVEPGVVRHIEGDRISVGEPDGTPSERCRLIADALVSSGLRCRVTPRIRREIWVKTMGNVAFNPISALTGATLSRMVGDRDINILVREIMGETEFVAKQLGLDLPISIDQRIAGAEKAGEHKTSMLQDLESRRPLELEAIMGAVIEIGERVGASMTSTRAVYACTKLLAKCRSNATRA
jgi:2-dehydropantoate 2-reductase